MVNSTPQHDADPEQTLSEEDNDTEMDISGYDLEQEELSNALRDEARNYNQTRLRGDTPEAYQFSYEPLPPRLPPPTEQLHRVYVLNCAHCQTFLSDRGMKVRFLWQFESCRERLSHVTGCTLTQTLYNPFQHRCASHAQRTPVRQ